MKISISYPSAKHNFAVLRLDGRLDADTVHTLEEKLEKTVGDYRHFILVCNMKDVEYASSGGIRVLVKYAKLLHTIDGKIAVTNLDRKVRHTFDMLGFSSLFEIYDNEDEAVSRLS